MFKSKPTYVCIYATVHNIGETIQWISESNKCRWVPLAASACSVEYTRLQKRYATCAKSLHTTDVWCGQCPPCSVIERPHDKRHKALTLSVATCTYCSYICTKDFTFTFSLFSCFSFSRQSTSLALFLSLLSSAALRSYIKPFPCKCVMTRIHRSTDQYMKPRAHKNGR